MKKFIAVLLCIAMLAPIMATAVSADYTPFTVTAGSSSSKTSTKSSESTFGSSVKSGLSSFADTMLMLLYTPVGVLITTFYLPKTIIDNIKDAIKYKN